MSIFSGKGMSVNVNLSDEQMEHISNLTADKVNKTRTHYMNETQVLQREVQDLRREVERRDKLMVEDLIRDSSYRYLFKEAKNRVEELEEEIEYLKLELDQYKPQ